MKKKLLPLALAAATGLVASTAQAVYVNSDGLGQVLLYPFYTVEDGQDTYVNLVNTTDKTKAVKVRILEAMNSQEVLDFNLYLSPQDHWSAVITADPNGEGAIIQSGDTSCTVPAAISNKVAVPFRNFEYQSDAKNKGVDRTREGYIEVIEMGEVDDATLEAAIKHTNGVPKNCGAVVSAWQGNGTFVQGNGVVAPAGGLYGYGVLINVAEGTDATYDAVALDAFSLTSVHTNPGSLDPSLNNAFPATADVIDGNTVVSATFARGIDAVSAVLMHDAIANDYVLEPTINAGTDWVITFPTKRDYVATAPATAPFTVSWSKTNTQACEPISITYYDREEKDQAPDDLDFSPLPPAAAPLSLCFEANVLTFNNSNVLSGSDRVSKNLALDSGFDNGWMTINMNNVAGRQLVGGATTFNGLPVTGFAVQKYVNGDVGGVKSNYAGAVTHKATRSIVTAP